MSRTSETLINFSSQLVRYLFAYAWGSNFLSNEALSMPVSSAVVYLYSVAGQGYLDDTKQTTVLQV